MMLPTDLAARMTTARESLNGLADDLNAVYNHDRDPRDQTDLLDAMCTIREAHEAIKRLRENKARGSNW